MVDEEGEVEVVFPWPAQALLLCLCSRLLSLFHDVTRSFFSLPSSSPSLSPSLSPSPRPPRHLHLSPPRLTSSPPIEHSPPPPPLFLLRDNSRLTPNNTRFRHKSRTCPP